jgi:hypothetical protein
MEIQEALKIMRALANGVNPETGESMEADSICRQPETVRALNRALGRWCNWSSARGTSPLTREESGLTQKTPRSARKYAAAPIFTRLRRSTIAAWVRLWRGW